LNAVFLTPIPHARLIDVLGAKWINIISPNQPFKRMLIAGALSVAESSARIPSLATAGSILAPLNFPLAERN